MNENEYSQRFYYKYNDQEYKMYRCRCCLLVFWLPMDFYSEFYEKQLPEHELLSMGYRDVPPQAKMFLSEFPVGKGTLLDVGCGDGAFVQQAEKAGFDVRGIDMDEKLINAAKKIRGLNNVETNLFLRFSRDQKEKFDFITFFEVLEHQDAPVVFIANIISILKKGGIISGSVPNGERPFPNLHKATELGDFPPAHFTRWSAGSLKYLFEKAGFTKVVIIQYGFENIWKMADWLSSHMFNNYVQIVKKLFVNDKNRAALSFEAIKTTEAPYKIIIMSLLRGISNILVLPL
ncbi:MAG: class I SAM-dependent methyltransferase, partial [Candidatus Margulisiibacteriota bacterium]